MGFYLNKTPKIISSIARNLTWRISGNKPILYITFDDGPVPDVTPAVIEILSQFNAKATFFSVGENVKKHPKIYSSIIDNGHSVGNHTYNHLNGRKTNKTEYIDNISKAKSYINSPLFRPPYGKITRTQIKELVKEYKIIMWDVLSGDFDESISPDKCSNNVIKNATNGSIVVFHDSLKAATTMLKSLPRVLKHFADLGFEFHSIPMKYEEGL